jgi:uncharacterized protein YajQ (UPF0234 family)
MPFYSFDIVSTYDKAEMNNVFEAVRRDIAGRYDFKGSPVSIEWMQDKKGFLITAANEWQIEAVVDIVRKKMASRALTTKVLDLTKQTKENNLKATKDVPFVEGLTQEKSKKIVLILREKFPKIKTQIIGDAVRVSSSSKNELQETIACIKLADLDFATSFINFR